MLFEIPVIDHILSIYKDDDWLQVWHWSREREIQVIYRPDMHCYFFPRILSFLGGLELPSQLRMSFTCTGIQVNDGQIYVIAKMDDNSIQQIPVGELVMKLFGENQ